MNERMNERMNEQMNEQMHELMDVWILSETQCEDNENLYKMGGKHKHLMNTLHVCYKKKITSMCCILKYRTWFFPYNASWLFFIYLSFG